MTGNRTTPNGSLFTFLRAFATNPGTGESVEVWMVLDGTHLRPASRVEQALYEVLLEIEETPEDAATITGRVLGRE